MEEDGDAKSKWLARALESLAPPLPTPGDDASWAAFCAGCMVWGCAPLYAGVAALAVVALRFSFCCRTGGGKTRTAALPVVIAVLAVVTLAGAAAFVAGVGHIKEVREWAAEMVERLRVVEVEAGDWLQLTRNYLAVLRGLRPGCPERVAAQLDRLVGWLAESEAALAGYSDELAGPRRMAQAVAAWSKSRLRTAALGILPLVMVLLSIAVVLRVVVGRRVSALKIALGQLLMFAVVGSSVLVVSAASAALSSLGVATAAICEAEDMSLLVCLQPSIDDATADVCLKYMDPTRTCPLMIRPSHANRKQSNVRAASSDRDALILHCAEGSQLLHFDATLRFAEDHHRTMQVALDPEDIHPGVRAAISSVCGGILVATVLVSTCWLVIGAMLLPCLFFVASDAVKQHGDTSASRCDTLMEAEMTPVACTERQASGGTEWPNQWAT